MIKKLKSIGKAILILFAFFFLYSLIGNRLISFTNKDIIKQYIENFVQLGLSIWLIYIFRTSLKNDLEKLKQIPKKRMFFYFSLFILAMILSSLTNDIIYNITNTLPNNEITVQNFIKSFPINGIISSIIFAPFYEEIIIRLNFKPCFKHKWIFILFTGILFGSFHMISATSSLELFYIIPYSMLGITLSYIFYDSETIFSSIFLHSLNNIIRIILIFAGIGGI